MGLSRRRRGPSIDLDQPGEVMGLAELAGHRQVQLPQGEVELEIVESIAAGARTVDELVDVVYSSVHADLRAAATHQVIVQLNKLLADERVRFSAGAAGPSTMVELIARQ